MAIKNCRGLMPDGKSKPSVLALSRQGMPNLPGSCKTEAQKGGYVVHGGDGKPDIILMSSGKRPPLLMQLQPRPSCAASRARTCCGVAN